MEHHICDIIALRMKHRKAIDRVARKQVITPVFFALTEPDLRLPYPAPENSLQTIIHNSSTTTQLYSCINQLSLILQSICLKVAYE